MKICTSLTQFDQKILRRGLKHSDLIEMRFDKMSIDRSAISSSMFRHPLIATYRPNITTTEKNRVRFLHKCLLKGAAIVDIELETKPKYIRKLKIACLSQSKQLMISYHHFEHTPSLQKLIKKTEKALKLGADIVKIATKVTYLEDIENLTKLQKIYGPHVIAFGMGKAGKTSRVSSLKLGAPICYCALNKTSKTAPGQYTLKKMRKIISLSEN